MSHPTHVKHYGAPEPVMPRPGRSGVVRSDYDRVELHAPADGRTWHAERCGPRRYPQCWRIGWSDGPPDRNATEDEVEIAVMALRGLGWKEVRHG